MQINLNLSDIKKIIGADLNPDDSFSVKNISSLEDADSNDIAFLFDRGSESVFSPVNLELVKKSNAGIIVAQKEIVPGKKYLLVKDPLSAFTKIINFVQKDDSKKLIEDTAVISNKADIHQSVKIGAASVVCDNAKIDELTILDSNVFIGKNVCIGKNVRIYSGVKILDGSIIGNNSIIHSNTVIGSDGFGYAANKNGLQKIPQIGIVQVGNNVEIGANTTIDRATFNKTIIGDGCKIDNLVMIAHNVVIGPHTAILAQTGIAGGVVIGAGCQIGGQVAIKDHIKIGNGAKIVSKSGVMKDIKDGDVVAGIPAMPFSKWKRAMIVFSMLPEYLKKFKERDKKAGFFKRLFS
ncbi:UDP-3-O-(3-hydroxymyristoyl)glucosamine N-acyltransferase [Candidatus Dependentiae bacterium]|nr:UDP-3-O-(3-hydroxymyristoyl)glucosamine N-acyltransferase [Candidatus Dependentiae bacterium]